MTPSTPVPRLAYSPNELAQALGMARATIYRLIDRGAIPSVKVGGRRLIPADVIERLMAEQHCNGEAPPTAPDTPEREEPPPP